MAEKETKTEETSETKTKTDFFGNPEEDAAGEPVKETKTTGTSTTSDDDDSSD